MSKKLILTLLIAGGAGVLIASVIYLFTQNVAVLDPQGIIADKQANLLIFATVLSLFVIVPVYFLTFFIAWKYREGNKKSKYTPDTDGNRLAETVWWGIPIVIILILSIVTWNSSHALDPYRPLESSVKPLRVQVVALQWKWLFIYPDQNIATLNYLNIPEDTPINFELTSDAPMNSFWIPKLGGQVYAMAGMNTKLHLQADQPGIFEGVSANLSGEGFAGMKFVAQSSTQDDFDNWVRDVQNSNNPLYQTTYQELIKPTKDVPETLYSSVEPQLYNKVVLKYGGHSSHKDTSINGVHSSEETND